jgi:hypothetical protein
MQPLPQKYQMRPLCEWLHLAVAGSTVIPHTGSFTVAGSAREERSVVEESKTFIFQDTETSRGFRLPFAKDAGFAL